MEKVAKKKREWILDDSPKTVEEELAILEDILEILREQRQEEEANKKDQHNHG